MVTAATAAAAAAMMLIPPNGHWPRLLVLVLVHRVLQHLALVLVLPGELVLALLEGANLFAHLEVVAARAGGVEGGAREGPFVGAAGGVGAVADEV